MFRKHIGRAGWTCLENMKETISWETSNKVTKMKRKRKRKKPILQENYRLLIMGFLCFVLFLNTLVSG